MQVKSEPHVHADCSKNTYYKNYTANYILWQTVQICNILLRMSQLDWKLSNGKGVVHRGRVSDALGLKFEIFRAMEFHGSYLKYENLVSLLIFSKLSVRQTIYSSKCPFGKTSVRQNVHSAKRPFGKTSVGKMSVGQNVFRQNVFRQSVFRQNVRPPIINARA